PVIDEAEPFDVQPEFHGVRSVRVHGVERQSVEDEFLRPAALPETPRVERGIDLGPSIAAVCRDVGVGLHDDVPRRFDRGPDDELVVPTVSVRIAHLIRYGTPEYGPRGLEGLRKVRARAVGL